jgi:hypothetical protein
MLPTQTELLVALCCGDTCKMTEGGHCHRLDFIGEYLRVRALLDRNELKSQRQLHDKEHQ